MQENSPYKAHKVRDCLEEMEIEVMAWPLYPSDLNPIEYLWKMLDSEIDRANPELKTMGNNNVEMDYVIQCAQETCETLALEL